MESSEPEEDVAEYVLPDSPAWDEVKAAQNGDGTGTFWANSFLPLWGRLSAITEYLEYDETKLGTTLTGSDLVMTADIVFDGPGTGVVLRNPATLANTDATVNMAFNLYRMASLTAARTYTRPDPTREGQQVVIVKTNNSAFTAVIKRVDTSTIVTFDHTVNVCSSASFISRDNGGSYVWGLSSWSGGAVPSDDP